MQTISKSLTRKLYRKLPYKDNNINWTQLLALAAAGLLSVQYPLIVTIAWTFLVAATLYGFAINKMKWLWYGVAASPAMELWTRMARASWVPHEIGKYYLLLAIVLLLFQHVKRRSNKPTYYVGPILTALLLPGIIVSLVYFDYETWVLNVLGIIQLAMMLIFIARERWTVDYFADVLKFVVLPIIPVVTFLVRKTPDFEKIDFILSSNFKTSGDFGGNQVSTILGLGIIGVMILLQIKRPFFKIIWLNYTFIAFLLYRGFLTFSRGGMIVAAIVVIVLFMPIAFSSLKNFLKFTVAIILLSAVSVLLFNKVNTLTNNQLVLRYMGETPGTLAGTKQRNINTITSYRVELARTDLLMFKDNWLWGVGIGRAKEERPYYGFHPIVSHTEFTRLLGEQGIGGLGAVLLLVLFQLWWIYKQKYIIWKAVVAALFTTAILTSLHSSMRTNTTLVTYILAAVPVFYSNHKYQEHE